MCGLHTNANIPKDLCLNYAYLKLSTNHDISAFDRNQLAQNLKNLQSTNNKYAILAAVHVDPITTGKGGVHNNNNNRHHFSTITYVCNILYYDYILKTINQIYKDVS